MPQTHVTPATAVAVSVLSLVEPIRAALYQKTGYELAQDLILRALHSATLAHERAYQPYVPGIRPRGVALVASAGAETVLGSEVQNAAFPSSLSAVSTAVRHAVSIGARDLSVLFIYGDTPVIYGSEAEVIGEFVENIPVVRVQPNGTFNLEILTPGTHETCGKQNDYYPTHHLPLLQASAASTDDFFSSCTKSDLLAFLAWSNIKVDVQTFLQAARAAALASTNSYSPFSQYAVGAACVLPSGAVVAGCNIETSTMNGLCAERVALGNAASLGHLREVPGKFAEQIDLVITYVPVDLPADPCAGCRQTLLEFSMHAPVVAFCGSNAMSYAEGIAQGKVYRLNALKGDGIVDLVEVTAGGLVPASFSRNNLY